LPKRRVDNEELAKQVDTSDQWIVERTGIRSRYIAGEGETTASLATNAARAALADAGIEASDVDLIVLATATPDQTFPSSATKVQAALGINDCVAFDVHAVCTGFLYAVRAEDGDRGILATKLHADGRHNDLLFVDGGPSTTGTVGKLRMKGREVFRHAVVNLADVLREVLSAADLEANDVDWVVPHQANARILDATAKKLNLPSEKVVVTVDRHANTSAASVPLALDAAVKDGRIKRGDIVVLEAMGGGFTWGAAVLRY
jgi:3-oxoacyl-[acyl-carrier-protein] synthase-3